MCIRDRLAREGHTVGALLAAPKGSAVVVDVRLGRDVCLDAGHGALDLKEQTPVLDLSLIHISLDRAHRIAKVHGGATSLERAHVTRDLTLNERSDLHNDDKERICARSAALVEPESFVSVSYTHLDVYKRQIQART